LLWALSACKPFEMVYYEWKFPFLGAVTYKGFFDKQKGLHEKKYLEEKGYDIDWGVVSGWSTLGFFKDPILESFLWKPEGRLANLIIHELTHGTIYIKNDVDFNENLASVIGDFGAMLFLKQRFGEQSNEYIEYIEHRTDVKLYQNQMVKGALLLDSLYNSFSEQLSYEEKNAAKTALINNIISSVDTLPLKQKEKFQHLVKDANEMKNAFFMNYMRYNSMYDSIVNVVDTKFEGNIKDYIEFIKKTQESL
jgi:predicted aminopeptidase